MRIVKIGGEKLPLCQHLLRLPQAALDPRDQRAVRVFQKELLEFRIRHFRFCLVAVSLGHQLEMGHSHTVLRFRGFRRGREKGDEVLVL